MRDTYAARCFLGSSIQTLPPRGMVPTLSRNLVWIAPEVSTRESRPIKLTGGASRLQVSVENFNTFMPIAQSNVADRKLRGIVQMLSGRIAGPNHLRSWGANAGQTIWTLRRHRAATTASPLPHNGSSKHLHVLQQCRPATSQSAKRLALKTCSKVWYVTPPDEVAVS
jgi:hypothetical protein